MRAILAYLDTLRQVTLLVQEPIDVPFYDDPQRFAAWVSRMADVTHANVRAVRNALPASVATFLPSSMRGDDERAGIDTASVG